MATFSSASFEEFFDDYVSLYNQQTAYRAQEFVSLFDTFRQAHALAQLARASTTPHLNILKLLAVEFDELTDSRFIAWLLDENGEHEQGTFFFQTFLKFLGLPLRVTDSYRVFRERFFPDPNTRVDLVVCSISGSQPFAVFIENKVRAGEQPDQLDRTVKALLRFSENHDIPQQNRIAVFLTVDGRTPSTYSGSRSPCKVARECSKIDLFSHFTRELEHGRSCSPLLLGLLRSYVANLNTCIP